MILAWINTTVEKISYYNNYLPLFLILSLSFASWIVLYVHEKEFKLKKLRKKEILKKSVKSREGPEEEVSISSRDFVQLSSQTKPERSPPSKKVTFEQDQEDEIVVEEVQVQDVVEATPDQELEAQEIDATLLNPDPDQPMENGGPLGKLRQRLLAKEQERKERVKSWLEKLKFWKAKPKPPEQEETVEPKNDCCHCHCSRQVANRWPIQQPANLVVKTQPVIYHVNYKDVVRIRGKKGIFSRQLVVHDRNYGFSYRSDVDLLRRDWELALARHSEQHPLTYNRALWTTTKHARSKMAANKGSGSNRFSFRFRPVIKAREQSLRVKKEYAGLPNKSCYYTVFRRSELRPRPSPIVRRRLAPGQHQGSRGQRYSFQRGQFNRQSTSTPSPHWATPRSNF